jgi:acyl-CoA synthetase (AMP-forming)/AMP-acid ligase II
MMTAMMTLGELTRRNGRHWPDKDAYVELGRRVTWGEVDQRTDALGHALRDLGVIRGDRVALLSHDCIEVAEIFLGAAKIGAIRVGFNPRLAAAEVAALIKDCTPRVFVYAAANQPMIDLVRAALKGFANMPVFCGLGAGHSAAHDYDTLLAQFGDAGGLEQTPFETAMIAYTSGSTGLPKGAVYPHDKFLRAMLYTSVYETIDHDTMWLHAMPAAGVPMMHMLRNVLAAGTCVIIGTWNPERALALIERERITHTLLIPTMMAALLNVEGVEQRDLSSLVLLSYGAAGAPPAMIRQAMTTFGCNMLQMYGLTELIGMCNMLFPSDHRAGLAGKPDILASVGRPLSYVDSRIVDDDGREVAVGETGELLVRSDIAFAGYWNAPEKTAEMFLGDWLRTGDIARRDADGYIYIADRAKFRMKSGGYNVFPSEVENVLAEHPAVHEVCVFGMPDATLKRQQSASPDELRAFCKDRIANFKIPKKLEIWDDLPRGSTGKIMRRSVIEIMLARTPEGATP